MLVISFFSIYLCIYFAINNKEYRASFMTSASFYFPDAYDLSYTSVLNAKIMRHEASIY